MSAFSRGEKSPGLGRVCAAAALAVGLALTGCSDTKNKDKASQTAAKVNKEEITVHQINFMLQQQRGLKPEQAEAAGRQILERLIDQELAIQKADELKLDRDPRVVQQLEAAKREIVARAYVERMGEGVAKPTPEEIQKYYDDKPALFKERRIYSIQEIGIEARPEQVDGLRTQLQSAKSANDFIEYLKANDYRFSGNQAVRAAEQLPMNMLEGFAKMKDGQTMLVPTPNGAQVIVLAGSRMAPVAAEQAKPAIEQFLLNERKRDIVQKDMKDMRTAAKIEYIGKFAEGAASAPKAAAPTLAPAQGAASGLDAASISKGMGLK